MDASSASPWDSPLRAASRSETMAPTAPRARADPRWAWPSVRSPCTATNSEPSAAWRESVTTGPVTGASGPMSLPPTAAAI